MYNNGRGIITTTITFYKEDNDMNKYIKCPTCGFEYLPGEIFTPKHFVGEPKNVIRNNIGEVLGYEGIEMDLDESFVCQNCDTEFEVHAKVNFVVGDDSDNDENKTVAVSLFEL